MEGQKRQAGSHAPGCIATGMHARQGREEGPPGRQGQQQEAASWGPPAGWASLLLGQGFGLSHPGGDGNRGRETQGPTAGVWPGFGAGDVESGKQRTKPLGV